MVTGYKVTFVSLLDLQFLFLIDFLFSILEEKLKKLRLTRNLTQKELAVKSGLTDAAIRNYELGNRSPSKEQLQ